MRGNGLGIDFDQLITREHTESVKFDARKSVFGTDQVIPLWVADMDFAAPQAVTRALEERARHPVYGYSLFPESLYQSMIDWFASRHGWHIERDWILLAPGVVPSLHAAAMAFAAEGEGIIIQPPVYPPFFSSVQKTGRRVIENPLQWVDGEYRMDLEHLAACAQQGARMLVLCSPHNPVGRVWRREELEGLLEITRQHDLLVVSDDIHCDLVFDGHRQQMLASMATREDRIITALAPSKTFNIPGMGLSALVIADAGQRQAIKRVFDSLHMQQANPFSIVAFEAAYRHGGPWLDALLPYLQSNMQFVRQYLQQHVPQIRCAQAQGTYLLWLDCRALGMTDGQLKAFFIQKAGVGLNPGISFGAAGSGYMRINIGTRRALLQQALEQIRDAVQAHVATALGRESR
ncbi:putative C-S lyase [Halopseudomonas laoshanensis]|uniref:cysteine-S-conjugate beta-lyase n=1 Tax=Halopseudomonas laoshanensis TaxID=2268758 RepID=A0A7V7GWL0_9GAMM|nr:putative C-S lyase [Halopseudomonas laoshanensis]